MAKKILIPPGRSNVDELDCMIYRYGNVLQTLTRCSKINYLSFTSWQSAFIGIAVVDLNKDGGLDILLN